MPDEALPPVEEWTWWYTAEGEIISVPPGFHYVGRDPVTGLDVAVQIETSTLDTPDTPQGDERDGEA